MAIYNAWLFAEERRRTEMAEFANTFNATLDRQKTLQAVVDKARALTDATSSSIFLWNSDKTSFELSARRPAMCQKSAGLPRSEQGTDALHCRQRQNCANRECARKQLGPAHSVKNEGTQSILGVPMQVKGERVGVLYVNSDRQKHFSQRDEDLIQGLANYGALAVERTRVLEAVRSVNQATADFLRLDDLISELLKRIVENLGFEFAALQLVNLERNMIETVDGINAPWGAECHHALTERDIQSHIVHTRKTMVIAGSMNSSTRRSSKPSITSNWSGFLRL